MALQMTVITPQGFDATNAYHRVQHVSLPSKTQLGFVLASYKDKDTAVAFAQRNMACAYDLNGDNPLKQAYTYLKTLPEFAAAVDC